MLETNQMVSRAEQLKNLAHNLEKLFDVKASSFPNEGRLKITVGEITTEQFFTIGELFEDAKEVRLKRSGTSITMLVKL